MSGAVLAVRHALSTWNLESLWQGRADPPLSPEGERQAEEASAMVGQVDLVVSSGMARAVGTATLLAPGVPSEVEAGLCEYDVGEWTGLTRDEIARRWPEELAAFDRGALDAPPGGESRRAFDRRVAAAAGRVARLIATKGAARTLVVAHGGVLRSMARSQGLAERPVAHLCGYEATAGVGRLRLDRFVCLCDGAAGDGGGSAAEAP